MALDKGANRDNLEKKTGQDRAGESIRAIPSLFAAGHGTSENGRFLSHQQDTRRAGQSRATCHRPGRLQDWLATDQSQRAIILLDTCESGALVADMALACRRAGFRGGVGPAAEATGRPVMTAAAAGQFAHEGLVGSSGERTRRLTWAVLDALRKGDTTAKG